MTYARLLVRPVAKDNTVFNDTDDLVLANLRLAPYCVRRFLRRYRVPPSLGLDMDDLVSEAVLALCRAAQRWEPARGSFSTYAGATIHNWLLNVCRLGRRSVVDRLEFVSLSTPVGETGDDCLLDLLPDPEAQVEDRVSDSELVDALHRAIDELPERERKIVLGIMGGRTVASIAQESGCSRQRVAQIHSRAIRRLRLTLGEWMDHPSGLKLATHPISGRAPLPVPADARPGPESDRSGPLRPSRPARSR